MDKKEPFYTVCGNANWCSHYVEQQEVSLKKTKNTATLWSCHPTPGHISQENYNLKRYIHPNVNAVLFTIAKTWRQPKCSSTDERMKKMWWYMHTVKYYLAIKKEWNNAICNNMDGPRDCHMWSMSERDKYHMILLVNWILKKIQMNLFTKHK